MFLKSSICKYDTCIFYKTTNAWFCPLRRLEKIGKIINIFQHIYEWRTKISRGKDDRFFNYYNSHDKYQMRYTHKKINFYLHEVVGFICYSLFDFKNSTILVIV